MATLKRDVSMGKVEDTRPDQLPGFQREELTSHLPKLMTEDEKQVDREKQRRMKEDRKEAKEKQEAFQAQLQQLRAEGKVK